MISNRSLVVSAILVHLALNLSFDETTVKAPLGDHAGSLEKLREAVQADNVAQVMVTADEI